MVSQQTVYYFFSTSAQSVAAIAGIAGAFGVFRYQSLLQEIERLYPSLAAHFHGWGYRMTRIFRDEIRAVASLTTDSEIGQAWGSVLLRLPMKKMEEAIASNEGSPAQGRDAVNLFVQATPRVLEPYRRAIGAAKKLRSSIVRMTVMGMMVIVIGIFGTLLPDTSWSAHVEVLTLLYSFLLVVYFAVWMFFVGAVFSRP